jgi:hypothetical protein
LIDSLIRTGAPYLYGSPSRFVSFWGINIVNMQVQPAIAGAALPIRDLQVGDIVRINGTKDVGRIISETCYDYTVCVFGETNREESFDSDDIEMWVAEPARRFKFGNFRIVGTRFNGRIGLLFEDNGNEPEDMPYRLALCGDETDEDFSASELIPWVPMVGDRVVELNYDDYEVGTVLANDGTTSHVQWDTRTDAPYWPNIRLEPAD